MTIATLKHQKWVREMKANGTLCFYCGKPINGESVTLDHKIPLSKGGKNIKSNIVPSCLDCNRIKADMCFDEYLEETPFRKYIRKIMYSNLETRVKYGL